VVLPALPFRNVIITGAETIPRSVIIKVAALNRASYFAFDEEKASKALSRLALLADADVSKRFPSTVVVTLRARRPVAVALGEVGGREQLLVFDEGGMLFQIGGRGIALPAYLPVLSGMAFEKPRLGVTLPAYLLPLLKDISVLEERAPAALGALSEIRINKKSADAYDLTLYPAASRVEIKTGPALNESSLSYILLTLDVLKRRGVRVSEIDFRTTTASYTVEGYSD
jgi:cell division septal protein FtsQ